jgi:Protein of unknown function (DUF1761)
MVWYSVVGGSMAELQQQWRGATAGSDRPMIWTLLAFATTSLVIATAVAVLFRLTGTTGLLPSVGLGLLLWIGFCATQWVGSIMGEDVPVTLAAIHAGDWLPPHDDHVRNHRSVALRGAKHEPVQVEGEAVLSAAVRDRT